MTWFVPVVTVNGGSVPEKFVVSVIAEPGMNAKPLASVSVTVNEGDVPSGSVMASEYVSTSPMATWVAPVSGKECANKVLAIVGELEVNDALEFAAYVFSLPTTPGYDDQVA